MSSSPQPSAGGAGFRQKLRQMFGTTSGRVVLMICLVYFITYVDRVNLSTLAPLIAKDLHLSTIELGIALSSFGYTYAMFQIIGGLTADKLGPRKTLVICGLIWTVGTLLTGVIGGLVSLIAARVLLGVGEGATFPTATSAMSKWVAADNRGYVQGIVHSCSRLANTITPPLVVFLALWVGWRGTFILLGCVSFLWVLAWAWFFRDDPRDHKSVTPQELATLPAPVERTDSKDSAVPWGPLVRSMTPTTLVYFCYNWTLWLYITWLPSYFVQAHGLNIKSSALFSFGVFGAGVVGDTLGGWLADRSYRRTGDLAGARRKVIVTSLLGSTIFLIPVVFVHDITLIAVCLSGAFFFLELTVGPIWAIPMDIAPRHAGTASGIMNTGSAIAGIVSPLAFGIVAQLSGSYALPFVGSIALLLLGAYLAWGYLPRHKIEQTQASDRQDGAVAPGDLPAASRAGG